MTTTGLETTHQDPVQSLSHGMVGYRLTVRSVPRPTLERDLELDFLVGALDHDLDLVAGFVSTHVSM